MNWASFSENTQKSVAPSEKDWMVVLFQNWLNEQFGEDYFIPESLVPALWRQFTEMSHLPPNIGHMELNKSPQIVDAQLETRETKGAVSIESLTNQVKNCFQCGLSELRTNTVFGEGDLNAKLFFVGEGPGEQEDLLGRPFVGPAGQLLTKIIEAMGYQRSEVYIANIIKCRPPSNRVPEEGEIAKCIGYLKAQIGVVRPKVIVALGATALKSLINDSSVSISSSRGKFLSYGSIPLMPTFHPSFLLRNPEAKKDVWDDMKKVRQFLMDI